jgi:predicted aminopeptidase
VLTCSLLAVCTLIGTGCFSARYLMKQGVGQLAVLRGRQPIATMLRHPDLRPAWRQKLQLILIAREYAFRQIGLKRTGAYSTVYLTHGQPIAYNVSAAKPDRLEPMIWTFPVVGALPYLGFFERGNAERLAVRLAQAGWDTYLRPVPAYSSLGWFDDPIYSSLLDEAIERLIEVVIHETTHTTIFIRGQVAFNESLAVFVGQQGTLNFLAQLYGPLSRPVRRLQQSIRQGSRFATLVEKLYAELKTLYAQSIPRAEKLQRRVVLFARAQETYRQIFLPQRWGAFGRRPLNNAVLLSYGRYSQGLRFHRQVYRRLGRDLAQMVALYQHAQHFPDPIRHVADHCGLRQLIPQTM